VTSPPDPNAPFVVIPVTRNQFWGILVALAGAYAGLIYVMVSIIYGGINDRINRLEEHFQLAIAADIEIKDLLKNAPHLIQDVK
jgi:hypothetical protein